MALQTSPNPPSEGFPEPLMHKNRLQQYAQRSGLPLPCYFNSNEGSMHAPNFISTVFVSGVTYKSSRGFSHVKEAEQDAARVAYESILNKLKEEGIPDLHVDNTFCKQILHEYGDRINLKKPVYKTAQSAGMVPTFTTTLVFDSHVYVGGVAKNKKEAEQLAARNAIQHLLGTEAGRPLSEIIYSKKKLYAALQLVKDTPTVPVLTFPETSGQVVDVPAKIAPLMPESKRPKLEPACEASTTNVSQNTTSLSDQSLSVQAVEAAGTQSSYVVATVGQKRSRKKNKKSRNILQNSDQPLQTHNQDSILAST